MTMLMLMLAVGRDIIYVDKSSYGVIEERVCKQHERSVELVVVK